MRDEAFTRETERRSGGSAANMSERGAGSGASPECASNSVSRAGHSTPATPPSTAANTPDGESQDRVQAAATRSLWHVPRSFRVGKGRKVHVGVRRKGEIIVLGCGMAGVVGHDWLKPTEDRYEPVTCGHCLRATQ